MTNTQNLKWIDLTSTITVPKTILNWLIDDKSLTAKLKQKYADFAVKVLSQTKKKPYLNEIKILNFDDICIVREVELFGKNKPVVFARSIIPVTKDTKSLLEIGSKPLGEILFNDANIKRGDLQITVAGDIWGRRSVFTIGKTNLLVSEFFLRELYA